jgi:hypothetical protein
VSEHAIVTHVLSDGTIETLAIEFFRGGQGFLDWVERLDKEPQISKVEVGGKFIEIAGLERYYDSTTQANTFAILMSSRPQVVAWNTGDMGWAWMKDQATKQDRGDEVKLGRPTNPVQLMQTWRRWAKKGSAVL